MDEELKKLLEKKPKEESKPKEEVAETKVEE